MFNSKKKVAQREAMAAAFADTLAKVEKNIADAQKIPDIGERYLAFAAVEEAVEKIKTGHIPSKPIPSHLVPATTGLLTGGGAVLSLIAAGVHVSVPLLIPFTIVGLHVAGMARVKQLSKRLLPNQEDLSFFASLDTLSQQAASQGDALVADHLLDFRTSPRFNEIFDKFPEVSSAFAKAAVKAGIDIPGVVQLNKVGIIKSHQQ